MERDNRAPSVTLAVVALISGLLSFCVPGAWIVALICGALARRYAWADPQRYGGYGMATIGFYLGGVTLLLNCIVFGIWWMIIQRAVVETTRTIAANAEAQAQAQVLYEARAKDRDKALHIARELRAFASRDTDRKFPARLAQLVPEKVTSDHLSSALSKSPPFYAPINASDWKLYADDVDKASDFLYVGAGLTLTQNVEESGVMIVYSRRVHSGGRVVAFANGMVDWVSDELFDIYFEDTNGLRAQWKLPQLVRDERPSDRPLASGAVPGTPGGTPVTPERTPDVILTTFTNLDDALRYVSDGRPEERRAALAYLARAAPGDTAAHDKVLFKIEPLMTDATSHAAAFAVLKNWATGDDLPLIRRLLEDMIKEDAAGADVNDTRVLLEITGKLQDKQSAKWVANCLKNTSLRENAAQVLIGLGSDIEESLHPLLLDMENPAAVEAVKILAKVGTEKSISKLHFLLNAKSQDLARASQEAILQIASGLGLKPEQYLYVLYDFFSVDAPVGFTEEKGNVFNARQWTRQAPGRAVRSTFLVEVKSVEKGYKIDVPAGAPQPMLTNGLVFYQLAAGANQTTRSVRWAAVEGQHLITITATMDAADNTGATNLTNAVNKIKVK